jgi:hypothetical protein
MFYAGRGSGRRRGPMQSIRISCQRAGAVGTKLAVARRFIVIIIIPFGGPLDRPLSSACSVFTFHFISQDGGPGRRGAAVLRSPGRRVRPGALSARPPGRLGRRRPLNPLPSL